MLDTCTAFHKEMFLNLAALALGMFSGTHFTLRWDLGGDYLLVDAIADGLLKTGIALTGLSTEVFCLLAGCVWLVLKVLQALLTTVICGAYGERLPNSG